MKPITALPMAMAFLSLWMMTPAFAQDSPLPEVRTQGAVSYLSGGIGSEETAAIKAETRRYALTLLFAAQSSGNDVYLASVPVSIHDAGGSLMLNTVTEGPYLLVNLAPGTYNVSARYADIEKTLKVDLKAGVPVQRSLVWPQSKTDTVPRVPATTAATAVTTPVPTPALPEPGNQGGVPYLTGGIGADESQAIKAQQSKYALALTFATGSDGHNMFLASVPVKILDTSGTAVLDVITAGPYLLIDLPPGRYEIVTTHAGKEQRAHVLLAAGGHIERAFVWPARGN